MPINIYKEKNSQKLEYLCEGIGDLPTQIDTLENWLKNKGKTLEPNKYIADIGFEIRKSTTGRGGILNSDSMLIMGQIGMDIFFLNTLNLYYISMTEFKKDNLSTEDAFWIMWYFLQEHHKLSENTFDVSNILSASEPMDWDSTGIKKPVYNAMVDFWNDALNKFKIKESLAGKSL